METNDTLNKVILQLMQSQECLKDEISRIYEKLKGFCINMVTAAEGKGETHSSKHNQGKASKTTIHVEKEKDGNNRNKKLDKKTFAETASQNSTASKDPTSVAGSSKKSGISVQELSSALQEVQSKDKFNEIINLANDGVEDITNDWKRVPGRKPWRKLIIGSNDKIEINGKEIEGIPKYRDIHVYRVDPGMTSENLANYVKSHFPEFLGAGLDALAKTMNVEDLRILKKEFRSANVSQFKLLTRIGVFPYDYINGTQKLDETKLPSIKNFYNRLNDINISHDDYAHAQNVWEAFELKKTYSLDPAWYYTMPGYTWDCMLKYTKCKLEILKDIDIW
ncbi:unnamed protein product [Phaedon cochleariae]|uniref:Uncharacterized protein n=1 Tax=Phaedon cochleariae TaxID=80249 RepID=A0A9N9SMV8_PHACE|nr:unnamed protein product [Phaedon cochleariae]